MGNVNTPLERGALRQVEAVHRLAKMNQFGSVRIESYVLPPL